MEKRSIKFELLRIVCIFQIVIYHYFFWGGYEVDFQNINSGYVFLQSISMFGRAAVIVFVMITGYFCVEKIYTINLQKILWIVAELYLYSIIIAFFSIIIGEEGIGIKMILRTFLPIVFGNWFVVNYIILMFLMPYLNKLLNRIEDGEWNRFVGVMLFFCSVVPTFTGYYWKYSNLDFMLFGYILGAYIKKKKIERKKSFYIIGMIVSSVLLVMSVLLIDCVGVVLNNNTLIHNATIFCECNSILAIVYAFFLFMTFKNLNVDNNVMLNNRIIRAFARTTLGIYILSDNWFCQTWLWKKVFPNVNYMQNPYLHVWVKVLIIVIICASIDIVRYECVEKNLKRYFCKKWRK